MRIPNHDSHNEALIAAAVDLDQSEALAAE
jgi:hypothetical protein